MNFRKLSLVLALAALTGAFLAFDLGRYLSLDYFKSQQAVIETYRAAHPGLTAGIFLVVYTTVTALSLPWAAILTLVGGAIFGLLWGTVLVSFASTLGATLAFLAARFVLRDWVRNSFGERLRAFDAGIEREGGF